jgi:hypothetical protein
MFSRSCVDELNVCTSFADFRKIKRRPKAAFVVVPCVERLSPILVVQHLRRKRDRIA